MASRLIVHIDEEKCNGCGACVPACVEGALQVVDGKVRVIEDRLCDGLGACIGSCPQDALWVEEREAPAFDEAAVAARMQSAGSVPHAPSPPAAEHIPTACPGSRVLAFAAPETLPEGSGSALGQWPVQLTLVPERAPFFKGADLLVAADCVPFAYGAFHRELLAGKALVVGCPKLDNAPRYVEKLAAIIRANDLKSITVAHMEVPCCFGMGYIVEQALALAGKELPVTDLTISVRGEIVESPFAVGSPKPPASRPR